MNTRSLRKTTISLAVVAAMCAGTALAGSTDASLLSVAKPVTLRHGDAIMGALPANQPMHVVIALKLRDQAGLDAFNKAHAKNPGSAPPMSSATFMANHAPSQVQAQTVANYLTRMGFSNVQIAPNRMLVTADGNAMNAGKAFLTSFAQVKTHDGRIAYANTSDVRIPASLGGNVLAVLGVENVYRGHLTYAKPKGSVHTQAITGHNPTDFSSIYGGTGVATASTVPVGIFTNGDPSSSITDLNTFTAANGLSTVTTSIVKTNGGGTDTSGQVEWDLDSQDIVGMGGGKVASITFYTAPTLSFSDMAANFNAIVSANAVKIANVSIGGCETNAQTSGYAATVDQILSTGVAQGQTFSISTGDSGADECGNGGTTPSWPANSPYAVAVAGTTLDASTGANATWNSETVWAGSGGSPSKYEPKPSYQMLLVPGNFRGVADVAFDADPNSGAIINVGSGTEQVGGTSLAAPIFAGLWARVLAVKGTSFGFANPYLYALPWADFHDITVGSNGGENAAVGYDFASGRGSVILNKAINDIGKPVGTPPTANFSYVATGLTAQFTNTSTAGSSPITNSFWKFGDGSAINTQTSPSYTYAGAGTYNVTLTVADQNLNLVSKTAPVTVAPAPNPIQNTGFESGTSPWSFSSSKVLTCGGSGQDVPHAGQCFAWLGKTMPGSDWVSQQITLPTGSSATLTYWLHIDSKEVTKLRKFDNLTVGAYTTGGALVAACTGFSNLNAAPGYTQQTCDLSAALGKTVVVKFSSRQDATLPTNFLIDDVTVSTVSNSAVRH